MTTKNISRQRSALDSWCAPIPDAPQSPPVSGEASKPVSPDRASTPFTLELEPLALPEGAIKSANDPTKLAVPIKPVELGAFIVLDSYVPVKFIRRPADRKTAIWKTVSITPEIWNAFRTMTGGDFVARYL